jgi:hypothetical protein
MLRDLESHLEGMNNVRSHLARVEVDSLRRGLAGPDESNVRRIRHLSQTLCAMERRLRELEEEVARIKRMLGMKPLEEPRAGYYPR